MNMPTISVNNGVNVEALLEAKEALSQAPAAAQFKWRSECHWINGTHSRSKVHGFFGLGEEQTHQTHFEYDADHPQLFAAEDKGSAPVEFVLVALASCLTAGVASVAQHRNIQLRSVKAFLEGDMDLQGVLGIDADIRNGFSGINVHFEIDADCTEDDKRALIAQSQKRSAVFDMLTNPTHVSVHLK